MKKRSLRRVQKPEELTECSLSAAYMFLNLIESLFLCSDFCIGNRYIVRNRRSVRFQGFPTSWAVNLVVSATRVSLSIKPPDVLRLPSRNKAAWKQSLLCRLITSHHRSKWIAFLDILDIEQTRQYPWMWNQSNVA